MNEPPGAGKFWYERWLKDKDQLEIKITHSDTGIAWAGLWIGLGIVTAAGIMAGQVILK